MGQRIMETRRRGWVWIVAAVAIMAIAYPLSFGPACWVSSHTSSDARNARSEWVSTIYQPILWLTVHSPSRVQMMIYDYASVGADPGWGLVAEPATCRIWWQRTF